LCARHKLHVDRAKEGVDYCKEMYLDLPTDQVRRHLQHHVHTEAVSWAAVVGEPGSWLDLDMKAIHEAHPGDQMVLYLQVLQSQLADVHALRPLLRGVLLLDVARVQVQGAGVVVVQVPL
jgi:hypothetical protein